MEESTKVSSEDLPIKDVNEEMKKEDNDVMEKEEEDTAFDGGFVKVEKEGIDTKYDDDDEKQASIKRSSSGSQRELHESQEKAKELEIELEKVTEELKRYESENTLLKDELFSTKGRLEEAEKKHEELEVVKKKLQEKIVEGEERQITHLKSLEDALQLHDVKHKELTEAKEAFDELTQELEKKKASESRFKEELSALEEKMKISEEKFSKSDALLSQALSNKSDLEQKLTSQMQEYQEKVTKLESSLNKTSARNSDLEEDLRIALQKGAEHENLGNVSSLRIVELEGLFEISQLKLEKAEDKLKDLEAFQVKNSSLEASLIVATEKEKKLLENLNDVNEKSKHLEERVRLYEEKLAEASIQYLSLKEEIDQSSSENELLADTNNQLKIKIQELEGFLDFEKETATRQIEEATERFNQRDLEAKDLFTKLKSHEALIEEHKRMVLEAKTRKLELEEALLKLKTLEATIKELEKENGDLADVNIKINQELANQGTETSDLQTKVSVLEAEKDQTAKELLASKKAIENLTNQLTSEGERTQSQVEKVAELTSRLQEHEHKASDRDVLHKELQDSHTVISEEKEAVSQKYSELEVTLKKSQEELEAKNSMIVLLESLYKELEQKVQLPDTKSKETESTKIEEVEVKSRDIDLSFTTPKQRKSKKEPVASSSRNVTIQKSETSHLMTLKIVLGVALVSVIIGIILGKHY